MSDELRAELYGSTVELSDRPASLPALLRTRWRVPLVVVIVGACRQRRGKREQIVVLNWALRDAETHAALATELSGGMPMRPVWIRYEPALVRATNIAHGLGLLRPKDQWLELTTSGAQLVEVIENEGLYSRERELLDALPRPLPFNIAERLLRGEQK